MRTLALLFLLAGAAGAQLSGSDLANPSKLGDEKDFAFEGVSFRAPEGSVVVASDAPDGQRVITASRIVRFDNRDEVLGMQIEVIRDLDLATYRRIVEGAQAARLLESKTISEERVEGRPAWRVDLPGGTGDPVGHLLAIDAGDRIIVATWSPPPAVAAALGPLLEESVRTLKVVVREPSPVATEPTAAWAPEGEGIALKLPDGWTVTDRDGVRALRNPSDRFENIAVGTFAGTAAGKAAEWDRLRRDRLAGPGCLEGAEDTFLSRKSFFCRSRLVHQGIEIVSATRLVEHRGRLFFVSVTERADRWEQRSKILEAILATVALEP